jgi:hypothetical protein
MAIPRIVHQIWLGANPPPAAFTRWRETFRRHLPDWEQRLWDDDACLGLMRAHFPGAEARWRAIPRAAQRADVARYMIVAVHGGLYADMDCECRRPLDFLRPEDELVVATELRTDSRKVRELYRTRRGLLHCQWAFLARPGHPFLHALVQEVLARLDRRMADDLVAHLIDQTGPGAFTDVLEAHRAAGGAVRIVPGEWFSCPDGASLPRFMRSVLLPELGRVTYIRHRSAATWMDAKVKRDWMLRGLLLLAPKPIPAPPAPSAGTPPR